MLIHNIIHQQVESNTLQTWQKLTVSNNKLTVMNYKWQEV